MLIYYRVFDEINVPGACLINKVLRSNLTCYQFEPRPESWPSYLVAPKPVRPGAKQPESPSVSLDEESKDEKSEAVLDR